MDHDERDARDPDPDRPDDTAAEPMSDETRRHPPRTHPASLRRGTGRGPVEAAPTDPGRAPRLSRRGAGSIGDRELAEPGCGIGRRARPTCGGIVSRVADRAAGSRRAEEGTWPTSAPERGDEAETAAHEPDWPPDESAAAAGAVRLRRPPRRPRRRRRPTIRPGRRPEPRPARRRRRGTRGGRRAAPEEAEAYPAAEVASVAAAGAAAHGVPDAEAAVGESTQCPRCGTENRPGLAFCRNCGQRLVAAGVATTVERPGTPEGTMACPRCGTHNRAGVAFCQNCGANLRGTAPGYVPPAVAGEAAAETPAVERRGAVLGPVVLLIGMVGLITGYLLPFGEDSLYDRAFGPGGYGIAFWSAYPDRTAASPTRSTSASRHRCRSSRVLLAILAVAGFMRARPGSLQLPGLVIALAWSVGLIVLFVVVEVIGGWSGDIVDVLRAADTGRDHPLPRLADRSDRHADAIRPELTVRYCPNCGTEVDDTAAFCPTCGQAIDQAAETEMPAAPAWPEPAAPAPTPRAGRGAGPVVGVPTPTTPPDRGAACRHRHPAPPPPPAAAGPGGPSVNVPVTMPVTLSGWLIGGGALSRPSAR